MFINTEKNRLDENLRSTKINAKNQTVIIGYYRRTKRQNRLRKYDTSIKLDNEISGQ